MQNPTTTLRPFALSEILAWGIILAAIGLIFGMLFIAQSIKVDHTNESKNSPDLQILMGGRSAVGAHALFKDLKTTTKDPKKETADADLTKSLDESAKTSWDKLRAAIVHGELSGKDAVLKDFDTLEKQFPELHADIKILRPLYTDTPTTLPDPLPPEWQNFHDRNGWFADLALSFNKPDTDAMRTSVIHAGYKTVLTTLGGFIVALLILTAGIALFIVALVFLLTGRAKRAFPANPNLPTDRRAYVQSFAAFIGLYVLLGVVIHYLLHLEGLWGAAGLVIAVATALAWPLLRGQSWKQYQAAMGLHTGRGFFTELGCGAVGYIAGAPVLALGMALTILLTKLTGVDASHPITEEILHSSPLYLLLLLFLATVWAPITEELMFRGAFFAHLRERHGWWLSALTVSIFFAAIHPQGWAAIPALGSIALILAAIREWRGSILGSMMAHCINNSLLMIILLLSIS